MPTPYPKLCLRQQLTGLSSQKFVKVIGVVSSLTPVSTFTAAGVPALIVPINSLREVRTQVDLLAIRPVLVAEAPKSRVLTVSDTAIVNDTADAILATSVEEIAGYKKQTPNLEIVHLVTITKESKDQEQSIRKKSIAAGATAVLFKSTVGNGREVKAYSDGKVDQPVNFTLALEPDHLPTPPFNTKSGPTKPLVKVCGVKTVEAAKTALDSGADMIGMILVPGRARTVDAAVALQISQYVRSYKPSGSSGVLSTAPPSTVVPLPGQNLFEYNASVPRPRPLIVGVFRNQPLAVVLAMQQQLELDIVQLHGDEPISWCNLIPVPVIKRFTPGTATFEECLLPGYFKYALLDSELGGEGKLVDRSLITGVIEKGARFLLAGGLTPDNVVEGLNVEGIIGVDVSGGVETNGVKDLEKVQSFVKNARSV